VFILTILRKVWGSRKYFSSKKGSACEEVWEVLIYSIRIITLSVNELSEYFSLYLLAEVCSCGNALLTLLPSSGALFRLRLWND
jgi:hypothetical protein